MADVGARINLRLDEIHAYLLCGERAAWLSWPTHQTSSGRRVA
jgi:hypothetical protein